MLEHTDAYISKCVELGILCVTPFRKYPLRPFNLAVVLKVYALSSRLPYSINHTRLKEIDHHLYYLTDAGLEWLYQSFSQWSLDFLRSTFASLFAKATPDDLKNLSGFSGLANFRGETGVRPKAGSKQGAMLVRVDGKRKQTFKFDTLHEARAEFLSLSRFYPIDQFKLYRLSKKGSYKEVQLILQPSKRGLGNNLKGYN